MKKVLRKRRRFGLQRRRGHPGYFYPSNLQNAPDY